MLNNAKNGRFYILEKKERIDFELIYNLITDIENGDLEIELLEALKFMIEMKENWLIQLF